MGQRAHACVSARSAAVTGRLLTARDGQGRYTRWTLARGHGADWVALIGVDATTWPPEPAGARRAA